MFNGTLKICYWGYFEALKQWGHLFWKIIRFLLIKFRNFEADLKKMVHNFPTKQVMLFLDLKVSK